MSEKINKNPIFFIGTGRNGSTLISDLVGDHPRLGWVSNYQNRFPTILEISYMNRVFRNSHFNTMGVSDNTNNKISYAKRLIPRQSEAYKFWNHYSEIDFGKSFMANQTATTAQIKSIRKAILDVLNHSGKNRFFAKLTGPGRVTFLHSIFPDAIFVKVERNPYHVLESFLKVDYWIKGYGLTKPWWSDILDDTDIKYWEKHPSGEVLTALQIKKILNQTDIELERVPENQKYSIMFEDFVQNPIIELEQLLKSLHLEKTDDIKNKVENMRIYKPKNDFKYKGNIEIDNIFSKIS